MSQAGSLSTSGGGGGSGVLTITGNTGGAIPPDGLGNITVITSNSTTGFSGSGNTLTINYNLSNLIFGSSLSSLTTGNTNVGLGSNVLNGITSGTDNTAIGATALQSVNIGADNTAVGVAAGSSITSGSGNHAFGRNALLSCSTGGNNIAIGFGALGNCNSNSNCAIGHLSSLNITSGTANSSYGFESLPSCSSGSENTAIGYSSLLLGNGSYNTVLGSNAGSAYTTTEGSNILIKNVGTVGESNTIRIGTQGSGAAQQNTCFVAGITGVTTSNSEMVTINTSTGQLGSATIPGGGIVSSIFAYKSSATANATGDGTLATVIFDTVVYDVHSDYDNSTGIFTVPVTGTYMVTGNVAIQNLGASTVFTAYVQSTAYQQYCTSSNAANVANTGLIWLPVSSLVRLTATQTIYIQVAGEGGILNNSIFGGGGYFTWLSIALVSIG